MVSWSSAFLSLSEYSGITGTMIDIVETDFLHVAFSKYEVDAHLSRRYITMVEYRLPQIPLRS